MSGQQDVFQRAMSQGHSAAWEQSWEQAAIFYRQAVDEFPENASALTSLGLALFELGRYDDSLTYYAQAAKLSPEDPLPVEKISQIFEQKGDINRARNTALQAADMYLKARDVAKALENWQRITSFQPDNLNAHTRLAMVYERIGRKAEAVMEYIVLASLFQRAGEGQKAEQAIHQALVIMPTNSDALDAQTLLHSNRQIPLQVRPATSRSAQKSTGSLKRKPDTETNPQDPISEARQRALSELANILFEMADDDNRDLSSRRGFQALVRGSAAAVSKSVDKTRIQLHLREVIDLQTRNDLEQAAVELERAIESGLEHPAAYYDAGYIQLQLKHTENAVRFLKPATQNPDYELAGRMLLGEAYLKLGQTQEASIEYLKALGIADASQLPDDQAENLREQYESLIDAQSQENNPAVQKQISENIASLLSRSGWKDELHKARQQLVDNYDGMTVPLAEVLTQARTSQIVESLSRVHQLDKSGYQRSAMEEALFALSYAPSYLPLHTYIAELLLKQDQQEEALAKFQAVAKAYSSRGESRRAVQIYRRVLEMAPMDLPARQQLIQQLTSMGQAEDALAEYMNLADVYYSLADLEKARSTYEAANQLAQNSPNQRPWQVRILHRMADIDLQSLDWRSALRIYEQVRNLDLDDEKARSSLIELNSRLGQDVRAAGELDNYLIHLNNRGQRERAVKFLQNLVREDPNRPWARRRLAEFYKAMGRIPEAIEQLDAMGEMLIDSGDIPGAIQAVEAILALNPSKADEYQQLLAQLRSRK